MNVDGIINNLQATFGRLGQSLIIQGDGRFSDSLTLGQVLKGRVLMHYEGTRYGVSFAGEEKVVDSAVPLRTGELIYGRVVGLGDKVHLQRQAAQETTQGNPPEQTTTRRDLAGMNSRERLLTQIFERYQASLPSKERALLVRLMGNAVKPELTVLSALVLNKMGLTLNAEAIKGVLRVLEREQPGRLRQVAEAPRLSVAEELQGHGSEEILSLARALEGMLELGDESRDPAEARDRKEPNPSFETPRGGLSPVGTGGDLTEDEDSDEPRHLGTWLLNGQGEGAVSHRVASFPLWFGERLIEVSVALFNQREGTGGEKELRHRRIVLALDTEHLGHVELVVSLARQNLRVEVRAQDDEATEAMAAHLQELREQLTSLGWNVDGISYATALPGERGEVVRAVVEHFVTQDSVNQLV